MFEVNQPFIQINGKDGAPLNNGTIYFGAYGLDPKTNPIVVYWDAAGIIPIAQPIKTVNGYPVRDGTPANIYIGAINYSVAIYDSKGRLNFMKVNASFTGPIATEANDGWMSKEDKIALDGKVDRGELLADLGLGTAALSSADYLVPISTVLWLAKPTAPSGFLICDGSAISRATYIKLFNEIGITFGVGDGINTFNIPNLQGEFIRGFDGGRGIDAGRVFGSFQDHQLQDHTHSMQFQTVYANALAAGAYNGGGGSGATGSPNSGNHGSETRPRNVALLPVIKF